MWNVWNVISHTSSQIKMAEDVDSFDSAVQNACQVFGVETLFPEQFKALKTFVYGTDVLLNLPTGFGKSLVFQMAPLVHAELSRGRDGFAANPVIIIISPLVSLMEDQTSYLRKCGISTGSIGEDKVLDMRIEKGECCVVFSSPESLLGNGRWRSMLSSDVYQRNLTGIVVDEAHCISHWGTSKSKEAMAFRRWFYKLSELRSLVPNKIPFMAVTATATRQTKETITSVLRFGKFVEVSESPDKANICYSVQTMDKRNPLIQYFQWIMNELKEKRGGTERTIIYCQTIKQCSTLYSLFVQEMGDSIFANDNKDPRNRVVEMLHALSSKSIKEVVLEEMGQETGCIRVLICTIAFGMGVNCKGVQRIIHLGPSKSVEAYIQESGRAGRDGSPSKALLLYQPLMLLHVEKDMKDYVKGKYTCRRAFLMGHFDQKGGKLQSDTKSDFVCCDLCSKDENLKVPISAPAPYAGKTRTVSTSQIATLKGKLIRLRKSLLVELLHQSPKGGLPVASVPELLIGFSDSQIAQVLENCDKIFSISDIKANVEIWKERHAYAIMDTLAEVFQDLSHDAGQAYDCQNYFDGDDEEDDDWDALFSDVDLMDVDWDNFSASNILYDDSTFVEESQDFESSDMHVPELGDLIDKVEIE